MTPTNMTHNTLQERLMSEAEKIIADKISECDGGWSPRFEPVLEDLDQIILHTVEQTIKEERKRIKKDLKDAWAPDSWGIDYIYKERFLQALTDTQHALRGIIK